MSPKQERFCREYVIDHNGAGAAVRAGYSKNAAKEQAARLLTKVNIVRFIEQLDAEIASKLELSAERVITELCKLGFANMLDYMTVGEDGDPRLDFSKITRLEAAALSEVTVETFMDGRGEDAREVRRVKFKLADKRAALVDLGRHLALFTDRVQVEGNSLNELRGFLNGEPPKP